MSKKKDRMLAIILGIVIGSGTMWFFGWDLISLFTRSTLTKMIITLLVIIMTIGMLTIANKTTKKIIDDRVEKNE